MRFISIRSKDEDEVELHINELQKLCINEVYSCNGELIRILKSGYIKPLVSKIQKEHIKLSNDIVFNKAVVSSDELFLYNLDRYICYVRDNYLINHAELQAILPMTLDNKYSDILLSQLDFHKDSNYEYYYDGFKKMFLYNFYENINYYYNNTSGFLTLKRFKTQIESYDFNNKNDISTIEKLFIKVINNRKNNLYVAFIPHDEVPQKKYHNTREQLESIIDDYYENNEMKIFELKDSDNYIKVQNNTIILFNLKTNLKGKSRKSLFIEFGIKNTNFNAKVEDIILEKSELVDLLNKLKAKDEKTNYDMITYINPTLKFNFWCDGGHKFLDIKFEYGNGCDYYSLSLNKKDIQELYNLIKKQIN